MLKLTGKATTKPAKAPMKAEVLADDEQVRKVYLGQHFELKKKTIDL